MPLLVVEVVSGYSSKRVVVVGGGDARTHSTHVTFFEETKNGIHTPAPSIWSPPFLYGASLVGKEIIRINTPAPSIWSPPFLYGASLGGNEIIGIHTPAPSICSLFGFNMGALSKSGGKRNNRDLIGRHSNRLDLLLPTHAPDYYYKSVARSLFLLLLLLLLAGCTHLSHRLFRPY